MIISELIPLHFKNRNTFSNGISATKYTHIAHTNDSGHTEKIMNIMDEESSRASTRAKKKKKKSHTHIGNIKQQQHHRAHFTPAFAKSTRIKEKQRASQHRVASAGV